MGYNRLKNVYRQGKNSVITKQDIEHYIAKIPPTPEAVRETLRLLQAGEIPKAAKAASEDRALLSYLKELVNRPVYGFRNEIKDVAQIFMVLGVSGSLQAVYNYLLQALSPKEWHFFSLNGKSFGDLQAELTVAWNKILSFLDVRDKEIETSITLLPSAVIISEALFNAHKNDVELIRSAKDIDLNTILIRLSGYSLFDIAAMIAKRWEMDEIVAQILKAASGKEVHNLEEEAVRYGKWMHLLLFYIFSKPEYIDAGLNDFLEFHIEFVEDIYEDFTKVMEMES